MNQSPYTRLDRLAYYLRRHLFFVVLIAFSLWYLDTSGGHEFIALVVTRLFKTAIALWMAITAGKFAFPKLNVQSELLRDNAAVGILMAGIIIAANL